MSLNKVMLNLAEMYNSGLSLTKIATQTGVAVSTVRWRLLAAGVVLRTHAEGMRVAIDGGYVPRGRKAPCSSEHRTKLSEARLRWAAEHAKGTRVTSNGYVEYTNGSNKGRSVHDVAMETVIGRRLEPNEVVHHRDRDKQHNDLPNLQLLTRSEHTRLHRAERAHRHVA